MKAACGLLPPVGPWPFLATCLLVIRNYHVQIAARHMAIIHYILYNIYYILYIMYYCRVSHIGSGINQSINRNTFI